MSALRLLYDMSFFIIVTTIGLSIVFGIIIDTFSELRDERVRSIGHCSLVCVCTLVCASTGIYLEGAWGAQGFPTPEVDFPSLEFLKT